MNPAATADDGALSLRGRHRGSRHAPALVDSPELTPASSERLRVAYHSRSGGSLSFYCAGDRSRPAYSVLMEDATATWRTFTVDLTRCGTVTSDFDDYGLASPWLTDVLNRAWQSPQAG